MPLPCAALPLGERNEEEAAGAEEDVAPPEGGGGRGGRQRGGDVLADHAVGAVLAQLEGRFRNLFLGSVRLDYVQLTFAELIFVQSGIINQRRAK